MLSVLLFQETEPYFMSAAASSFPLPMAASGEPMRVVGFSQGMNIEKRLAGMGLSLGSEIHVLQREGGNLVVALGNTRLALGCGLAQKVLVIAAQD